MARFKTVDVCPRMLPAVLEEQLASGTVEHALHTLIDTEFDLSGLAAKLKNDDTGAPAYDPVVMLRLCRADKFPRVQGLTYPFLVATLLCARRI